MRLLSVLSVGYVVILVVALAASLIAILAYLVKIAGALGSVKDGLLKVEESTRPLAEHLNAINYELTSVSDGLHLVDSHLGESDRCLDVVGEQLGIKEQTTR